MEWSVQYIRFPIRLDKMTGTGTAIDYFLINLPHDVTNVIGVITFRSLWLDITSYYRL